MEEKNGTVNEILAYITVFFLLLAALFGGQIMTFIFGVLGPDAAGLQEDSTQITNETGAWLNTTTYTVDTAGIAGFSNLVITSAINTTDNSSIGTENFTVVESGFTNATSTTWDSIWVSYSYSSFSDAHIASLEIQNNSLQAIVVYSEGSSNQMNVVTIAIILILLIGVFLLFWNRFIKDNIAGKAGAMNFGA